MAGGLRAGVLVVLTLMVLLLTWSPTSQAAPCAIGNNTVPGCFLAPVVYTNAIPAGQPGHGQRYASRQAAAHAWVGWAMTQSSDYDRGMLTAPLSTTAPTLMCSGYTCGNWTDFGYNWGHATMGVTLWGTFTDHLNQEWARIGTNTHAVTAQAVCPTGHGTSLEFDPINGWPFYYYCYPQMSPYASPPVMLVNGSDGNPEGCATGCNPVDLASGAKIDRMVDYQNASPFPISWTRHYNSHGNPWSFEYDRSVNVIQLTGTPKVTLTRPNGGLITFTANTDVLGSAWTWTPTKPTVLSTFQEVQSSGAIVGYVLTDTAGTQEHYNADGQLEQMTSVSGETLDFAYDGKDRLTAVVDSTGRGITIEYDDIAASTGSYIRYAPDPNPLAPQYQTETYDYWTTDHLDNFGRYPARVKVNGVVVVEYDWQIQNTYGGTYPGDIMLNGVSVAGGAPKTYLYGEGWGWDTGRTTDLTGIIDENSNRYATYKYRNGKIKSVEHGTVGDVVDYWSYGTNTVTDATMTTVSLDATALSTLGKHSGQNMPCATCGPNQAKSYTYDAYGNPTEIVDFDDRVTERTYDGPRGLILTETHAPGTALEQTTTYTWHSTKPLLLTMVEPTLVGGSAHTKTTTIGYNGSGQATSVVVSTSSGEASRTWTITRTADGDIATITHPTGRVEEFVYSVDRELIEHINAEGTALERSTEFDDYDVHGNPGTVTFPDGGVMALIRDARQRVTETEYVRGAMSLTSTIEYNPIGLVGARVAPDGTRTEYGYDTAHRLITIRQEDATLAHVSTATITWNTVNRVTQIDVRDPGNVLIRTKENDYDYLSRHVEDIGALNQTTTKTLSADGLVTSVEDPLAHETTMTYDALGRLSTVTDADSNVSSVTYSPDSQIDVATDARGVETAYSYNGFGELLEIASPDRGTWTRVYANDGLLSSVEDPRGVVQNYVYDDLDRVVEIEFDDTGVVGTPAGFDAGTVTHTITYDSCTNGLGQVCSIIDATGTRSYTYDSSGRVTSIARADTPTGLTPTTGYGYDSLGRITSMTYPSGKVLQVTYDDRGQIAELEYDGQTVVQDVTWNAMGQLAAFEWSAAGLTGDGQVFSYDQDGQPEDIVSGLTTWAYTLDADGRITAVDDTVDSTRNQDFTYDALDRMTSQTVASWSDTLSYEYDEVGNRISKRDMSDTGQDLVYGVNDNRLASVAPVVAGSAGSPVSLAYDTMGAVRTLPTGQTMLYDATGRLTEYVDSSIVTTMSYDAAGQRVRTNVSSGPNAGTRLEVYDIAGRLIGVYAPNGIGGLTVIEELITLDGWRVIATVRPNPISGMSSPVVYPVVSDHLAAPRAILDPSSGGPVWTWVSPEAFGTQTPNENPSALGTFRYDGRFPGQRFDASTGLLHNGFRSYAPSLGRYLQSDPLGLEAGWNTYVYVGGNPMTGVDPWGLSSWQCRRPLGEKPEAGLGTGVYRHDYLCVTNPLNPKDIRCSSQTSDKPRPWGTTGRATRPDEDYYVAENCTKFDNDENMCMEKCIYNRFDRPRPAYSLAGPSGTNCQEWVSDVRKECENQCVWDNLK